MKVAHLVKEVRTVAPDRLWVVFEHGMIRGDIVQRAYTGTLFCTCHDDEPCLHVRAVARCSTLMRRHGISGHSQRRSAFVRSSSPTTSWKGTASTAIFAKQAMESTDD
mgnify:CR=1 FL=1